MGRAVHKDAPTAVAASPARNRRRLPRGTSSLPQALIAEIQRERLLEALMQRVCQQGFVQTTVADVVTLAGVSRKTFYECFADKDACYLAGYSRAVRQRRDAVRQAIAREPDGSRHFQVGLAACVHELARDPASAVAYFAEASRAQLVSAAVRQEWLGEGRRQRSLMRTWSRRLCKRWPEVPAPADRALRLVDAGVDTFLAERLSEGEGQRIVRHIPALLAFCYGALGFHELARAGSVASVRRSG